MTTCGRCAAANRDDAEFCGSCGAFLEFEERAPRQTVPDDTDLPPRPPVSKPPVTVDPPQLPEPPFPKPPVPGPPVTTTPRITAPTVTTPRVPANPITVDPVTVPAPVQPDDVVKTRRTRVEPVEAPVGPADLTCPRCGTGNDVSRRFCRRCGEPLDVAVTVKLSWWRRLLNRFRRQPTPALYRPRPRRRLSLFWPILAVLLVVVLIVAATPKLRAPVTGAFDRVVTAVRDRMADPAQVIPKAAQASSSAPGVGPNALFDGGNDTPWLSGQPAPAVGDWVELELHQPARVLELLVTSGYSTEQQQFLRQARPSEMELTVTANDGRTTKRTVELADRVGQQHVKIGVSDVVRMRLAIISAYDSQPGRHVAIAELEVFVRD